MIGITSYRDYFSTGYGRKLKSLKSESLHQFRLDIEEALGQETEIASTKDAFKEDYLSKYSSIVLFDHPMSSISQKRHVGFTTANLHHHAVILKELAAFDGKKYLISDQIQNIDVWLRSYESRLKTTSVIKGSEVIWPSLETVERVFDSLIDITEDFHSTRNRKVAVFGDSHSTMLWSPGTTCYNLFGVTLYRALTNGLESYKKKDLDKATFCFGNIDLRYHLAQRETPEVSAADLAKEYVRQASGMAKEVKIASLLPVTGEINGIMKAYLYKKQQYFGSFEQRQQLRTIFRDELLKHAKGTNVTIIDPPTLFETADGFLNEAVRENRGVHVCPSAYEYCLSNGSSDSRPEFAWTSA